MQDPKVPPTARLSSPSHFGMQAASKQGPHSADRDVGRHIATIRVQSGVTRARLAAAVDISFQQLQKNKNVRNRVSASMLYEIVTSLGVPVSRLLEGLPGNKGRHGEISLLPVDERITFIASAEGRRLIEGLMRLHPRLRGRVLSLIAALAEQFPPTGDWKETVQVGIARPIDQTAGR